MAETIPCPACGSDNPPDAPRCHVCDYDLRGELHVQLPGPPAGASKCPRCGSGVAGGAAFCQVCGQSVDQRRPRPQTGALNVREMFGDLADAPSRTPIRQFTEIAPSANPPAGATFAPPGSGLGSGLSSGGGGGGRRVEQPAPARTAAPYMSESRELDSGPFEEGRRDTSAPRGRRRPAPRPRPNYAGFDSSEHAVAQAAVAASPVNSPVSSPAGGNFAPGYADGPNRSHAAPRPQANAERSAADPGASAANLPRPRNRAEAHPQPIAPHGQAIAPHGQAIAPRGQAFGGGGQAQAAYANSYADGQHPSWGSPQPQARTALRLVLVGRDGQEGESFPLTAQGADIGRQASIGFPSDPFVSPQHARITPIEGGVHLADLGSRNGVYLRLAEPAAVYPGDYFLLGNQLLRLDRLESAWQEQPLDSSDVRGFGTPAKPPWALLTRLCVGEIEDDRYHLRGTEITIGREQGELVFPSDGFLSRAHARVRMAVHDNAMTVILEDLDSANGTYLRIRGAVNVPYGGMFRVGDQIFRVKNT